MLIVADDFTGACDAAGPFGAAFATRVTTALPTEWPEQTEVLAIDLDVRERSDAHAVAAMRRVAALAAAERVFVKIDSTLRGPVRGLIDGALEAFGRQTAVIAPAFPEQGRTYRDGRLYVNGRAVASLHEVLGGDARYRVFDDLREAAEAPVDALLVGSAGLARQLAPPHRATQIEVSSDGPVLVVAGSPTAVTRSQLDYLTDVPHVVVLSTPATDERDEGQAAMALAERVGAWAEQHVARAVVLTGGATARAVNHRLGTMHLQIVGELQPGIPVAQLQDGLWHGMIAVTKAGGFGTPQTLLDVVRALGVSSTGC